MASNVYLTQLAWSAGKMMLTGKPQFILYNANMSTRNLRHLHARSLAEGLPPTQEGQTRE